MTEQDIRVFAKIKGFSYWPARINPLPPDVSIPKGKLPIFFYGTYQVSFVPIKNVVPYEKFKEKWGKPKPNPQFTSAMQEIETNPEVFMLGKDPRAESFLLQFYQFEPTIVSPSVDPVHRSLKYSRHSSSAPSEEDAKHCSKIDGRKRRHIIETKSIGDDVGKSDFPAPTSSETSSELSSMQSKPDLSEVTTGIDTDDDEEEEEEGEEAEDEEDGEDANGIIVTKASSANPSIQGSDDGESGGHRSNSRSNRKSMDSHESRKLVRKLQKKAEKKALKKAAKKEAKRLAKETERAEKRARREAKREMKRLHKLQKQQHRALELQANGVQSVGWLEGVDEQHITQLQAVSTDTAMSELPYEELIVAELDAAGDFSPNIDYPTSPLRLDDYVQSESFPDEMPMQRISPITTAESPICVVPAPTSVPLVSFDDEISCPPISNKRQREHTISSPQQQPQKSPQSPVVDLYDQSFSQKVDCEQDEQEDVQLKKRPRTSHSSVKRANRIASRKLPNSETSHISPSNESDDLLTSPVTTTRSRKRSQKRPEQRRRLVRTSISPPVENTENDGLRRDKRLDRSPSVLSPVDEDENFPSSPVSHKTPNQSPTPQESTTRRDPQTDDRLKLPLDNPQSRVSPGESDVAQSTRKSRLQPSQAPSASPKSPEMSVQLQHLCRDLKASLIRGHENFTLAVQHLTQLTTLPMRLPHLVEARDLMDCIKKCRRYKLSEQVRDAAQKTLRFFQSVQSHATGDEIAQAQSLIANNQQRSTPAPVRDNTPAEPTSQTEANLTDPVCDLTTDNIDLTSNVVDLQSSDTNISKKVKAHESMVGGDPQDNLSADLTAKMDTMLSLLRATEERMAAANAPNRPKHDSSASIYPSTHPITSNFISSSDDSHNIRASAVAAAAAHMHDEEDEESVMSRIEQVAVFEAKSSFNTQTSSPPPPPPPPFPVSSSSFVTSTDSSTIAPLIGMPSTSVMSVDLDLDSRIEMLITGPKQHTNTTANSSNPSPTVSSVCATSMTSSQPQSSLTGYVSGLKPTGDRLQKLPSGASGRKPPPPSSSPGDGNSDDELYDLLGV